MKRKLLNFYSIKKSSNKIGNPLNDYVDNYYEAYNLNQYIRNKTLSELSTDYNHITYKIKRKSKTIKSSLGIKNFRSISIKDYTFEYGDLRNYFYSKRRTQRWD